MARVNAILITIHVAPDAGYAIDSLLAVFISMARKLVVSDENIHLSFPSINEPEKCTPIYGIGNILEFDPSTRDMTELGTIQSYIREHGIDVVFGFDQPVQQVSCRYMRWAGARRIISYQGAPMSSLNHGFKLLLKKLEVRLRFGSPDHYIFESLSMAETAYRGRGVPQSKTSIVRLGVDEKRFRPALKQSNYAYDQFNIPVSRKIIYYSGHMEERKGVSVLMRSARELCEQYKRDDFHFLILGNRKGQETRYLDMLRDTEAINYVTFGGYRTDIDQIIPCCYLGAIASTGWDSFTMSSLEIAACGLPLLVSRLQGLVETIEENKTGYTFTPGDYVELSRYISRLLDDSILRDQLGASARKRIVSNYTKQHQIDSLANVVQQVIA